MTEETFAEKFPSLEKEINTPEPCDDSWTLNDCYDAWMMAVEKHCLDKQKVKDAIEFIFRDKSGIRLADYDYLKEELGLDK